MPDQLHADHDALRRVMRTYATLLTGDPAKVMPELLRERLAFSTIYHHHRRTEAAFATAAVTARAALAPLAVQLTGGERSLDADYSAHVRCWSPALIVARWTDYRAEVLSLQRRLGERLAWEERQAIPLLTIRP